MSITATVIRTPENGARPYQQRGSRNSLGLRAYNLTKERYGSDACVFPPTLISNKSGTYICLLVAMNGIITTGALYDMNLNFLMELTATSDSIYVPQDRGKAWLLLMGNLCIDFTEAVGMFLEERESGVFSDTAYVYTEYLISVAKAIPALSSFSEIMAASAGKFIIQRADFCRKLFRLGDTISDEEVLKKTAELMEVTWKKLKWQSAGGTTAPASVQKNNNAPANNGGQQSVTSPSPKQEAPAVANNIPPVVQPNREPVKKIVLEPKQETVQPPKQEQTPKAEPPKDVVKEPVKESKPVEKPAEPVKEKPVQVKPEAKADTDDRRKDNRDNRENRNDNKNNKPKPKDRGISVLESAVPGLKAYNTALSKLNGKGLFHILVFVNGDTFFSSCLEREIEILHEIGILEDTVCRDGGNYQKGSACVFGISNASKALEAVEAGAYAFFCGNVPKEIRLKANVFDISGAGAAVAENWLTQAGMEVGCDMSKVLMSYPGWDKIPMDEFVNNTVMKHFAENPDVLKIKECDFEWIKDWLSADMTVPEKKIENKSIAIKNDTMVEPQKAPEIKASAVSENKPKVSDEPTWDEIEPDFDEPVIMGEPISEPVSTVVEAVDEEPNPISEETEPVFEEPVEVPNEEPVEEPVEVPVENEDDTLPDSEPSIRSIVMDGEEPDEPDFGEPDFDEPSVQSVPVSEPPKAPAVEAPKPAPVQSPAPAQVVNKTAGPVKADAPKTLKKPKAPSMLRPRTGLVGQYVNRPAQQQAQHAPAVKPAQNGPIVPPGAEPMSEKKVESQNDAIDAQKVIAPLEAYTGPVEMYSTQEELEQREKNAMLFDAIMEEHEHVLERIRERGTAWHDRLLRGYERAVNNKDYLFFGASFCNTEYGNGSSDTLVQSFYKSALYSEVYNSEMRVREMAAKIKTVKRGALCMACRHKFEAEITTAVGESTEVKCPTCGNSVRVALTCDGGEGT